MTIRPTTAADLAALETVLDQTRLFPSEMLPDLFGPAQGTDDAGRLWLSCLDDAEPCGFCYAAEETLAAGTWNMLAIAVAPGRQRQGAASRLVAALELRLAERGGRILIAETSGTDAYAGARAFYRRLGYVEEARIRDFWGPGDDKLVFWKSLAG